MPLPLCITRIAPRGAPVGAKPLKSLHLGTDTASICVKIGVFLWCFRNSGAFLQQGCTNTTPTQEVSHFYHTPSRTCTRAHTHARYAHTHTHTRRHTHAQARAHTPRRSRASAFLSPTKSENKKRITPANHPESPKRITLGAKRITPNHRKNTFPGKNFNFLFFCFQRFNIFIR